MSGNRQTPKPYTLSTAKQLYIGAVATIAATSLGMILDNILPRHLYWITGVVWLAVYLPAVLWVLPEEPASTASYEERPFKL